MITYYFNNLHPQEFQRLINALLVCKFGEDIRLTPLKGQDGGRDGETAPGNPNFPKIIHVPSSEGLLSGQHPRSGRYLFQVKHHSTIDRPTTDARNAVVSDFRNEIVENVITRDGSEAVNYFLLLTNVPSSASSLNKIDEVRTELLKNHPHLHADVWWSEHITALLDLYPRTWQAFPSLFAGNAVPMLAAISEPGSQDEGTPAAIKLALSKNFKRDSRVKFQQIDLENDIFKLFVDLEVSIAGTESNKKEFLSDYWASFTSQFGEDSLDLNVEPDSLDFLDADDLSAVNAILTEPSVGGSRLIVEGGPGQGKSTVTQVVAQIHRSFLLNKPINQRSLPFPAKLRVPFRIELRYLAEWISTNQGASLEQYICNQISSDSGGNIIDVRDFHKFSRESRLLLIFDGLDEIGSDDLKDKCVTIVQEGLDRLTEDLKSDVQVVLTTRPPAFSNFEDRFPEYIRLRVQPMDESTIETYVAQWLKVQGVEEDIVQQIGRTFEIRSREPHVRALARNPMQLSVLLHFIRLKGEAFPSKRAELYREYFKVVIDRDVAKTPELAGRREIVELLHEFLGYKIHALSEAEKTDGSIKYSYLIELVNSWLKSSGEENEDASDLLRVGEERLGLLVATKGEGESTHYGFEIQPIREYFAAAYISNQSSNNAHECFQELVVRPFWREVALFLAGLRRNNEKADLIYRLIAIDEKHQESLLRPGIELLLPLAEEGIFDQPPTLFNHAVQNLLLIADPDERLRCAIHANYFERLTNLVYSRRLPKILRTIEDIRNRSLTSSDDSLTLLSCNLGARVLDETSTKGFVKSLRDFHPRTLCTLRLQPLFAGIDIIELTKDSSFWNGVDDNIWQEYIWRINDHENQVTFFHAPDRIYTGLLSLFATDQYSVGHFIRRRHLLSKSKLPENYTTHCVWLITFLNEALEATLFSSQFYSEIGNDALTSLGDDFINGKAFIPANGLNEKLSETCQKLILLKFRILRAIGNGEPQSKLQDLIASEFDWLESGLKSSGLVSLVICRSLSSILKIGYFYDRPEHGVSKSREQLLLIVQDLLKHDEIFRILSTSLTEFYSEVGHKKDKNTPNFILRTIESSGPNRCRLNKSKQITSIPQAKFRVWLEKDHPDSDWLNAIPLSPASIFELVKGKSDKELADVLAFIGLSNFDYRRLIHRRVTKDQRKISMVSDVNGTADRFKDNPGVLSGYLLTLLVFGCLGEGVYRLIKSGALERYNLNRRLPNDLFGPISRRLDQADSEATLQIQTKLANDIIDEDCWPISAVRSASLFLARDRVTEHDSLITLEEKLGL